MILTNPLLTPTVLLSPSSRIEWCFRKLAKPSQNSEVAEKRGVRGGKGERGKKLKDSRTQISSIY